MRLRVGDEIVQERITRSGDGTLDLSNSPMHFAGLPPDIDSTRYVCFVVSATTSGDTRLFLL